MPEFLEKKGVRWHTKGTEISDYLSVVADV